MGVVEAATTVSVAAEVEARRQRATRWLLFIAIPLFWSPWYIYSAYLSPYAKTLGAPLAMVGAIVALYGLTQLVLRIPIGVACDRLGRRKLFVLVGTLIGTLNVVPILLAPQPWTLLLGRALGGIGAACWVPLSVLLVASYPRDRLAQATSMATFLAGLGSMLPSYAGGLLAQVTNVNVPLWTGLALGGVALLLLSRVPEAPAVAGRQPTSLGSLLSVGRVPLVLVFSLLGLLVQYNTWATTQMFVPLYAAAAPLNANKAQLGLLMATWQACNTAMCFFSSYVTARLGTRWTSVLGLGLATLATAAVPAAHSLELLFALRAAHGIGTGIIWPVLMAGALSAVGPARRTATMGFYQSIYAIGMVAGPAVSGALGGGLGVANTFYVISAVGLGSLAIAFFLPHRVHSVE